jgi:hypothetical protein
MKRVLTVIILSMLIAVGCLSEKNLEEPYETPQTTKNSETTQRRRIFRQKM